MRDVETAQRAYDASAQRVTPDQLEGQNNQANTRLLSPAVEPLEPSRPKVLIGILGVGARRARRSALRAALAMEAAGSPRARPEDLIVTAGVPVIGVLRPAGSKRPVFRRLLMIGPRRTGRPLLAAARERAHEDDRVDALGSPPRATRSLGAHPDRQRPADARGRRARAAATRRSTTCASAKPRSASACSPRPTSSTRCRASSPMPTCARSPGEEAGLSDETRRRLPAVQRARRAAARDPQPADAALVRQGRAAPGADGRRRRARRRAAATWRPTSRSSSRSSASARCWSTPTCARRGSTSCSRSRTRSGFSTMLSGRLARGGDRAHPRPRRACPCCRPGRRRRTRSSCSTASTSTSS